MDLRVFFHKVRQVEQQIVSPHAVVVSLETNDGGKPGVMTEVSREAAAKLVVEGRARLATREEGKEFQDRLLAGIREHEQEEIKSKVNLTIISDEELQALRNRTRKQ